MRKKLPGYFVLYNMCYVYSFFVLKHQFFIDL